MILRSHKGVFIFSPAQWEKPDVSQLETTEENAPPDTDTGLQQYTCTFAPGEKSCCEDRVFIDWLRGELAWDAQGRLTKGESEEFQPHADDSRAEQQQGEAAGGAAPSVPKQSKSRARTATPARSRTSDSASSSLADSGHSSSPGRRKRSSSLAAKPKISRTPAPRTRKRRGAAVDMGEEDKQEDAAAQEHEAEQEDEAEPEDQSKQENAKETEKDEQDKDVASMSDDSNGGNSSHAGGPRKRKRSTKGSHLAADGRQGKKPRAPSTTAQDDMPMSSSSDTTSATQAESPARTRRQSKRQGAKLDSTTEPQEASTEATTPTTAKRKPNPAKGKPAAPATTRPRRRASGKKAAHASNAGESARSCFHLARFL